MFRFLPDEKHLNTFALPMKYILYVSILEQTISLKS